MAPKGYSAEFRRRMNDLVKSGRPVAAVAAELGSAASRSTRRTGRHVSTTGLRPV